MAKSTTSANNTLDWQLGGATPTRPTTRFISMHTADPGATGASECSGSGYARQSLTFNAASAKAATNASATYASDPDGVRYIRAGVTLGPESLAAFDQRLHGGTIGRAAIIFDHNQILSHVNQTTRQVTRVRGL